MNAAQYFWEVPDFWKMLLVLLLFAAMATIAICFGPTEQPNPGKENPFSTVDAETIYAWELTKAEWDVLTDEGRAFYRANITKAPRFNHQPTPDKPKIRKRAA